MIILLLLPDARMHKLKIGPHVRSMREAPLSLVTLAALLPDDPPIEWRIVDGSIDPIPFDAPADLVGISVLTGTAPAEVRPSKSFAAKVELVEYFGSESCVTATAGDDRLMLVVKARSLEPGDDMEVVADLSRLHFFPPEE